MNKSDYLRNALLNHTLRGVAFTPPGSRYVALYTVAPTSAGGGTEVTGGAYVRQSVTFAAPSGFACANSGLITFPTPTVAWGEVLAVAILDASTAGNMLYFGDLPTHKVVDVNDVVTIPVGFLSISES